MGGERGREGKGSVRKAARNFRRNTTKRSRIRPFVVGNYYTAVDFVFTTILDAV